MYAHSDGQLVKITISLSKRNKLCIASISILAVLLFSGVAAQATTYSSATSVPFHQPVYATCVVPGNPSHLLVFFTLNNEAGLTSFLDNAYYNPNSFSYHNFISSGQFDAQYSAPSWVFQTVESIFSSNGLSVISIAPMLIEGSGNDVSVDNAISQISANAGIQKYIIGAECMSQTVDPDGASPYYTPTIAHVSDSGEAKPQPSGTSCTTPTETDSVGLIWFPCGLETIYDENPLLNQQGNYGYGQQPQTIALVDAYGDPNTTLANNLQYQNLACSDFATFNSEFNLPSAPCSIIYPTGVPQLTANNNADADGWGPETAIDTQYSHTMDPHAHILEVTASTDYDDLYASVEYVVNHQLANMISLSWGEWEDQFYCTNLSIGCDLPVQATALLLGYDEVFQQAAAQGISVFVSSGDYGAYDPFFGEVAASSPATDPWVSAVGGTTLNATFTTNSVTRLETAWSLGSDSYCAICGSGGGFSMVFSEPKDQQLVHISTQGVNSISEPVLGVTFYPQGQRGVPDLAADADPSSGVFIILNDGLSGVWGGTSLASPLTAGMTALIASHIGWFNIGDLAPTLYQLYLQQGHSFYVHQTTFNNYQLQYGVSGSMFETASGQNGPFTVTPGVWNPVAGLGQLNAYGLSQVITNAGY